MAYDIVVLGGGPGGYVAAIRGAQLGARVAVIEQGALGGTCLNRGCIPTKALMAGVSLADRVRGAGELGLEVGEIRLDLPGMIARKNRVVDQLVKGVGFLFKKNKVDLIEGRGKVIGSGMIEVTNGDFSQEVLGGKIILATGSEPALIKALGYNGRSVITSNEILDLTEVPETLLIVGGGVVGCEMATIFAELGSRITIVEAMPTILPMIDKELARKMQGILKKKGMIVKTGAKIKEIREKDGRVLASLESGEDYLVDKVLLSIGRTFNSSGLGLEEMGMAMGPRGEILVDDYMRTSVEGIYAVGDVTNKIQLAHVASAQGIVAVENILGKNRPMDYSVVPSCIFTIPEVASVGLTSQEAEEKGIKVKQGRFFFLASGKAVAMGETEGFIKIIADEEDRVLGVHIMGPHATDLIAEGALAMSLGAKVTDIARTIHAHPTLAEAVMEAAEALHGLSIHG